MAEDSAATGRSGDLSFNDISYNAFEAVYDKVRVGKQGIAISQSFFEQHAAACEAYASAVKKIQVPHTEDLSLRAAWDVMGEETKHNAEMFTSFASNIREMVKQPMLKAVNMLGNKETGLFDGYKQIKKKRDKCDKQVDKLVSKTKNKKLVSTDIIVQIKQAEQARAAAETEFDSRKRQLLSEFQGIEEFRLAIMDRALEKFSKCYHDLVEQMIVSAEKSVHAVEKCDIKKDLQQFIFSLYDTNMDNSDNFQKLTGNVPIISTDLHIDHKRKSVHGVNPMHQPRLAQPARRQSFATLIPAQHMRSSCKVKHSQSTRMLNIGGRGSTNLRSRLKRSNSSLSSTTTSHSHASVPSSLSPNSSPIGKNSSLDSNSVLAPPTPPPRPISVDKRENIMKKSLLLQQKHNLSPQDRRHSQRVLQKFGVDFPSLRNVMSVVPEKVEPVVAESLLTATTATLSSNYRSNIEDNDSIDERGIGKIEEVDENEDDIPNRLSARFNTPPPLPPKTTPTPPAKSPRPLPPTPESPSLTGSPNGPSSSSPRFVQSVRSLDPNCIIEGKEDDEEEEEEDNDPFRSNHHKSMQYSRPSMSNHNQFRRSIQPQTQQQHDSGSWSKRPVSGVSGLSIAQESPHMAHLVAMAEQEEDDYDPFMSAAGNAVRQSMRRASINLSQKLSGLSMVQEAVQGDVNGAPPPLPERQMSVRL
eukprot:TRINITY_DN277_c3_g3_i2.p1 TRINITY_DN277_c3_g3~~TRINITY_DN277_c3_g3_i2.p1  ORF type:complete len:697 (-),score=205.56 TRINITY_DN277_c3_g3_i2:526-2616(-)